MENSHSKLNPDSKKRVLEVKLSTLEGALIRKLRDLDYGQFTIVIHKIEGQPVRIEITQINSSKILQARDGLDWEEATYVAQPFNLKGH